MTTGSRLTSQQNFTNSFGNADVFGQYYNRVWSGSDRPRTLPTYKTKTWTHKGKVYSSRKRVWVPRPSGVADSSEHPYTTTQHSEFRPIVTFSGSFSGIVIPPGQTRTGSCNCYWGPGVAVKNDSWTSNDDLVLLGKLREQIVGSDFNAGVFLAEGGEAVSMIGKTATTIAKSIGHAYLGQWRQAFAVLDTPKSRKISVTMTNYSRRQVGEKTILLRQGHQEEPVYTTIPVFVYTEQYKRKLVSQKTEGGGVRGVTSKDLAGRWLELQYGWKPLLQDVKGAAEFLAHHFQTPLRKVYTARRVKDLGELTTSSPSNTKILWSKCRSTSQIKAILEEVDVIGMAGLKDPLSVVWEKIPYSFVVDWFIPIGQYLSARGMSQSLTGTFVTTRTIRFEARGYGFAPAVAKTGKMIGGESYRNTWLNVTRTVSTKLAIPKPSFKPLAKVASWGHSANALALLEQKRSILLGIPLCIAAAAASFG